MLLFNFTILLIISISFHYSKSFTSKRSDFRNHGRMQDKSKAKKPPSSIRKRTSHGCYNFTSLKDVCRSISYLSDLQKWQWKLALLEINAYDEQKISRYSDYYYKSGNFGGKTILQRAVTADLSEDHTILDFYYHPYYLSVFPRDEEMHSKPKAMNKPKSKLNGTIHHADNMPSNLVSHRSNGEYNRNMRNIFDSKISLDMTSLFNGKSGLKHDKLPDHTKYMPISLETVDNMRQITSSESDNFSSVMTMTETLSRKHSTTTINHTNSLSLAADKGGEALFRRDHCRYKSVNYYSIYKCANTNIRNILHNLLYPYPHTLDDDIDLAKVFRVKSRASNLAYTSKYPPRTEEGGYYSFTFVRDPITRFISGYTEVEYRMGKDCSDGAEESCVQKEGHSSRSSAWKSMSKGIIFILCVPMSF